MDYGVGLQFCFGNEAEGAIKQSCQDISVKIAGMVGNKDARFIFLRQIAACPNQDFCQSKCSEYFYSDAYDPPTNFFSGKQKNQRAHNRSQQAVNKPAPGGIESCSNPVVEMQQPRYSAFCCKTCKLQPHGLLRLANESLLKNVSAGIAPDLAT